MGRLMGAPRRGPAAGAAVRGRGAAGRGGRTILRGRGFACGGLTSTPIDCNRKRTSLLPMPIWAANSSTRIFPIVLCLLPDARLFGGLGLGFLLLARVFVLVARRQALLGRPRGLEDLLGG